MENGVDGREGLRFITLGRDDQQTPHSEKEQKVEVGDSKATHDEGNARSAPGKIMYPVAVSPKGLKTAACRWPLCGTNGGGREYESLWIGMPRWEEQARIGRNSLVS